MAWALAAAAGLAALLVGGPFVFFNVIEGKAPARLTLPPAATAGAGVRRGPRGPLDGTWSVAPGSEAGYRVPEVLFGQHHTAVGRTDRVTGSLVISGTTVTAADFTVDVASIRSDQASRDAQFRGYIMETYRYRDARFRLVRPIRFATVPAEGAPLSETATGDLSMRGVSRLVTFTLRAEWTASGIAVDAGIPVVFSRWHIPNPSFAVARVGGSGVVEVLLRLARAPG